MDKKNVLLAKNEDKWLWPHAVVLYTTCTEPCLSLSPSRSWNDYRVCPYGERKRLGLTSSITTPTTRQQVRYKTEPQIWSDNLALTCHVFKRLNSNFWRMAHHLDGSDSSHAAPLFFPRQPFYIKALTGIARRKWDEDSVLLQPLLVCWWDDKGRDRRSAMREAPGPVSCCSRAGEPPCLWRQTDNVREQQSTRDLLQDIQALYSPSSLSRSLIYLCIVIPIHWYHSARHKNILSA